MKSIDNYYLLLALMHGVLAASLLILIITGTIVRVVRLDMKYPSPKIRGSSFGFTLAGIFVIFGVTLVTVYLGLTAMPVLALVIGWAEGYLIRGATPEAPKTAVKLVERKFGFRRVLA